MSSFKKIIVCDIERFQRHILFKRLHRINKNYLNLLIWHTPQNLSMIQLCLTWKIPQARFEDSKPFSPFKKLGLIKRNPTRFKVNICSLNDCFRWFLTCLNWNPVIDKLFTTYAENHSNLFSSILSCRLMSY